MQRQDAAAQQADFEKRQATPPSAGEVVLFGGFMPALLGGSILLLFGIGVLAVAWQGYRRGELPAGSAGRVAISPAIPCPD